VLSVVIAMNGYTGRAGMAYWLIGPVMMTNGFIAGAARTRLRARLAAEQAAPAAAATG
jgi:hypothetical protein